MKKIKRTYTCNMCGLIRDEKFPEIEESGEFFCPHCKIVLQRSEVEMKIIREITLKKQKIQKEGTPCKFCSSGKVIHNKNPGMTGKNKILCTNPKCERYYICSCGKLFGTHLIELIK